MFAILPMFQFLYLAMKQWLILKLRSYSAWHNTSTTVSVMQKKLAFCLVHCIVHCVSLRVTACHCHTTQIHSSPILVITKLSNVVWLYQMHKVYISTFFSQFIYFFIKGSGYANRMPVTCSGDDCKKAVINIQWTEHWWSEIGTLHLA